MTVTRWKIKICRRGRTVMRLIVNLDCFFSMGLVTNLRMLSQDATRTSDMGAYGIAYAREHGLERSIGRLGWNSSRSEEKSQEEMMMSSAVRCPVGPSILLTKN